MHIKNIEEKKEKENEIEKDKNKINQFISKSFVPII